MKIVEINAVPYGSPAMIAKEISKVCFQKNQQVYFCYSWTKKRKWNINNNEILIGSLIGKSLHIILSMLTGLEIYFSFIDTLIFIQKIRKIKPDIVHIHILHSWYMNIPLLFRYLKKSNIDVVWTFHDCWAFTGHCPHFEIAKCKKWKTKCFNCPIYSQYPKSLFDNSKKMFTLKKKWFTILDKEKLTIVTPSLWLADKVKQSFMNKYRIVTINNGIDLTVFRPIESDFREKNLCKNKKIILGVALDWGYRKGLDVFVKLAKELNRNYQIVLVGTNDKIDQHLPNNIISIHKTENKEELAKIYSAADLFLNPTREDTFPTVNIEALACGLPVLTYRTGGSPEIIDSKTGKVVEKDDYESLKKSIIELCKKTLKKGDCINRAKNFSSLKKCQEYSDLYDRIIKKYE